MTKLGVYAILRLTLLFLGRRYFRAVRRAGADGAGHADAGLQA